MVSQKSTASGVALQESWGRLQELMRLKKSQQSLKDWTKQKWRTSSGKKSEGKRRYLPDAAWRSLSSSEKAATNRAKAAGNRKGKQFVAQPDKIKKKTARFR
jgi:hypothetical protein